MKRLLSTIILASLLLGTICPLQANNTVRKAQLLYTFGTALVGCIAWRTIQKNEKLPKPAGQESWYASYERSLQNQNKSRQPHSSSWAGNAILALTAGLLWYSGLWVTGELVKEAQLSPLK